jgi:tripeptide aminopeptidase
MEMERLLQRALRLQQIPAPTFIEAERAAFLAQAFHEVGMQDVTSDDIGNVYARLPGGPLPALVITAHLDTVFPLATPLEVRRTEDTLYGPGIGDNAIALSALVELGIDFLSASLAGDIWLVGTVGEEGLGNLCGMREVVRRFGDTVRCYIVLEGMALGQIYHQGLPIRRYRIEARTPGGHAWKDAGKPSAIHALVSLGSDLLRLPLPLHPRTTLNIGQIEGGTSINSVAAAAYLNLDLRSEDEQILASLVQEMQHAVETQRKAHVELEATLIGERPAGGVPEQHPLVQAAIESLHQCGVTEITLGAGSTDASFPLSLGLPAICVGLTRGGGAHSVNEFIEIPPLAQGYQALLILVDKAFHLQP